MVAKRMMCQPQPLLATRNVRKSSRFYQAVLQCRSGHGGDEYEQLTIDGRIVLQLHRWEVEHDHGKLIGSEKTKARGNGIVLWFMVENFEKSLKAIKKTKAKILKDVSINENANHREIWIRDPDGYVVVIASRYGDF